jgi:hypothetical protein
MSHTIHPDAVETDTEILDVDWLAAPSRRSRFRVGLLAALAILLIFLGGVEVQKRWGATDSSSVSGAGPTGGSFPGGGSFPSGGLGGSFPSGSQNSSQTPTGTSSGTAGTSTPAVIGKLIRIHGHTWTVKDLGGKTHTVKVTGKTTLTRSFARATRPVRTGGSVTVQGTTNGGTVTATAITIR